MSDQADPLPRVSASVQAGWRDEISDMVRIVVIALFVSLMVRMFFVQPFNIPSASMRPTLLVGDFVLVSKTHYGYSRASLVWPLTRLPVHGRVFANKPMRGDVVVFKNKKDGNRDYIKRLIGLPGDTIWLREGQIFINDVPVPRDFLGTVTANCDGHKRVVPAWRETLDTGATYTVHECFGDEGRLDTKGPYAVPDGQYFMMGDNRDQSQDSRVTAMVGTVPMEDFVGKATRVIASVDGQATPIWKVWAWPEAIRTQRFFAYVY